MADGRTPLLLARPRDAEMGDRAARAHHKGPHSPRAQPCHPPLHDAAFGDGAFPLARALAGVAAVYVARGFRAVRGLRPAPCISCRFPMHCRSCRGQPPESGGPAQPGYRQTGSGTLAAAVFARVGHARTPAAMVCDRALCTELHSAEKELAPAAAGLLAADEHRAPPGHGLVSTSAELE